MVPPNLVHSVAADGIQYPILLMPVLPMAQSELEHRIHPAERLLSPPSDRPLGNEEGKHRPTVTGPRGVVQRDVKGGVTTIGEDVQRKVGQISVAWRACQIRALD